MNEELTKDIVREKLNKSNINKNFNIEPVISTNPRINKILQNASKSGSGKGRPEFIITDNEDSDYVIIIECKADVKKHISKKVNKYKDYAVDGAVLYSSYLSKEYDVISIGVSGEKEKDLLVSGFFQERKQKEYKKFFEDILDLEKIKKMYLYDEKVKNRKYEDLLHYNRELNQTLHIKRITEDKRSLLISGVIIALKHKLFQKNYLNYKTAKQLTKGLVDAILDQLQYSNLHESKIKFLEQEYSFIKNNETLSSDKIFFENLIVDIDKKINSFVKTYKFFDIFGEFYVEFLRYANNDKGLGIVLTPKHITELFCKLAGMNKDSVVFDNCCGTGGFLITSMREMIKGNIDALKEKNIKEKQIVGIEFQDSIFPLAVSSMIIHEDGKTNIIKGDCFKQDIESIKKEFKPNIGLLNPPFKTDKKDIEEYEFVLNNLDGLVKNGVCVAIVPIGCVLATSGIRKIYKDKILKNHTLEAVISLPEELFYNSKVATVVCAIVIKANVPHPKNHKTYFGYWKNDGFTKIKNRGRVDTGKWIELEKKYLDSFKKKETKLNLSVTQIISSEDEWCAEAFMETDYSKLKKENFINKIHEFSGFQFLLKNTDKLVSDSILKKDLKFDTSKWKWFRYDDIFDIYKGYYNKKPIENLSGEIPFIGATEYNNGITSRHDFSEIDITSKDGSERNHKIDDKIFDPNCITISNNGSVGYAFYQTKKFTCSHDVNPVRLKKIHGELNPFRSMFLATLIELEKFRWAYGRKWRPIRMPSSLIKLPVNEETKKPDWKFMDDFIKTTPYSYNLSQFDI